MKPEPLPRWNVLFLYFIIVCFVGGLAFTFAATWDRSLQGFGGVFYVGAAAFGMAQAVRMLRMHSFAKNFALFAAQAPVSIQIDGETGYAMVTKGDGELVSLHVPEDVLEAGPEAVMDFVIATLAVS